MIEHKQVADKDELIAKDFALFECHEGDCNYKLHLNPRQNKSWLTCKHSQAFLAELCTTAATQA